MNGAQAGWAGFWQDEPAAQSGATLADLPAELRQRMDRPWARLAARLPPKARVLDLATGGGVVLEWLREQRADLKLTGVDSAPQLPKRPGMVLRPGISTESLPFENASFDAVTSRFGIEYGHIQKGASEASRVLRTGGSMCLLVHHAGSNIVRHNYARRDALRWAAKESGWVERAFKLAQARASLPLPVPPAFRAASAEANVRFPDQSAAWEFLTGLAQVLERTPPRAGEAAVRQLVGRAEGELARLDALVAAACDVSRVTVITELLERGGVQVEPVVTVDEPDGTPLAWLIEGRRA